MRVLVATAFLLAMTLAGCSGSSTQSSSSTSGGTGTSETMDHTAKTYDVGISRNQFSNTSLMLKTGDAVVWTDNDAAPTAHTVTSDSGDDQFDSNPNCAAGVPVPQLCMTQGQTYQHVFAKEGTFTVHCKIHSSMTMQVMVMAHNMTMEMRQ